MTTQNMQSNASDKPRREVKPLNGVDTPAPFATINAVGDQPERATFQFRARGR